MFRTVYTKTLFTLRWSLFGWLVGVMAIAALTMSLFDSFNQTGINDIVDAVPTQLQSLVGDVSDFITVPGYIGQQIFGPNLYIITIIMSILLFIGISSREEESGVLQTLLSLPVSRTRVYFEKLFAVLTVIAIVIASVAFALWISLSAIEKDVNYGRIWESVLELFVITSTYGLIAYSLAMGTGRRTLTMLFASTYVVASFLISTLAPAIDSLKTIDKFSLLHYYNSPQVMSHGINEKHLIVLCVASLVLIVVGWLGFVKRNIYSN